MVKQTAPNFGFYIENDKKLVIHVTNVRLSLDKLIKNRTRYEFVN